MAELLTFESDCDDAVSFLTQALSGAGLRVMRSFDLRSVVAAPAGCNCSHHGTEPCDCQMVVLLVYGAQGRPATLVAFGHNGRTWITLDDSSGQRPTGELEATVTATLKIKIRRPIPVEDSTSMIS